MNNQSPKHTHKELLEMFPEAKELTKITLKEERQRYKKLKKEINGFLEIGKNKKDEWFVDEVAKVFFLQDIQDCEKRMAKLKMFVAVSENKPSSYANFQEKVELAKNYSIESLVEQELPLRRVGNKYITNCIFHNETTPSLFIYPKTNSFYCFGCQKSGNSITLAMEIHKLSFKETVKLLNSY